MTSIDEDDAVADESLTTKEEWCRFVERQPRQPVLADAATLGRLSAARREEYDEARRDYHGDCRWRTLAAITGRHRDDLARALPELRDPAPDWTAWRHQPQPRCPRCDGRHEGGPVTRLLPHHRYICTRHRYWIGPPVAGQIARRLDDSLDDIVRAQWQHLQLLRRHGSAIWFSLNPRGGNVILHHRHIRPVLVRDWSPKMDGITATIWASQSTTDHYRALPGFAERAPTPRSTDHGGLRATEIATQN